jgi:hypothetical protein
VPEINKLSVDYHVTTFLISALVVHEGWRDHHHCVDCLITDISAAILKPIGSFTNFVLLKTKAQLWG